MRAGWLRVIVFMVLFSAAMQAGEIRGRIVNAAGGEPLGRVLVSIAGTRTVVATSDDGRFSIKDLPPGTYTMRIDAVGFWLQKVSVVIVGPDDVKEYSIALVAEGLPRTDVVEVKGDIFRPVEPAGLDQMSVTATELKSTATLLSADLFRTVQVLPGVTSASNNDFFSEFNVLGAPFSTIAIYIDDVQLRNPIQGIPGFADSASVSVFSSDTIESLTLIPTAFSERYADGIGGALDIRTREGARMRPVFRVSAGLLEAHGSAEGGFAGRRGSWLFSGRKSYMGYILRQTGIANAPSIGFYNADGKITYDLTGRHSLEFYALDGNASLDRTNERNVQLEDNTLTFAASNISLARLGWRFAQSPKLVLNSRVAFIREDVQTRNPSRQLLDRTYYDEWVGGTTAVWSWKRDQILEAGYDARRLRGSAHDLSYCPVCPPPFPGVQESIAQGTGLRQGGYVQQTSTVLHKRLQLVAGLRWDHLTDVGAEPVSPQLSVSYRVAGGTSVQFAFGRYLQFGDISKSGPQYDTQSSQYFGPSGWFHQGDIFPMYTRGTHYLAAVEHRIGDHARIRLEAFDREEYLQRGERRLTGPCCSAFYPKSGALYGSWRQQARGFELIVQRRSSNRLAGWVGYTYENVRNIYTPGSQPFPLFESDFPFPLDQRHAVNAFASYRLKPTVNLSGKWMYGSAYPIPAWIQKAGVGQYVANPQQPNYVAMPDYARLDVRADKVFNVKGRKLTFSAELINATNHRNMRFLGYDNFDPVTKRFSLILDRALPIAPTFGFTFEF
jgi:hypothetical protein